MRGRRPVLGAISGLFFGLFLGLDLLLFGVVRLDSAALTILPIAGFVVGIAGALWAPLGPSSAPAPVPAAAPSPFTTPPPPSTGGFESTPPSASGDDA